MPIDAHKASRVWQRFLWCRDNGHADFVRKADICDRFFQGDQWDKADLAKLKKQRRPALTINKILSTMSNVMGEQIYNRSEINFRPRSGASPDIADVLTKVFKQISDNNQLDWKRSDMFADGVITSRGFLDVRMCFGDSMQGEVAIERLNPKNVLVDPDAEDYDPDSWNEVFISKWLTAGDIAVLYDSEDAEILRQRDPGSSRFGLDAIEAYRDRFGDRLSHGAVGASYGFDESDVLRNIRVIERQYRQLDRQKWFLLPQTGDMRPIPEGWDRNKIALFVDRFGFKVVPKLVNRIKWTVVADNVVLHDEWSPYKHFTVVPYFPHFRHGKTIGLVENLTGPQELLNKVASQELHVLNTTANSGWIVKAGALVNMTREELEQRGAETGLVVETNDDPAKALMKIQPNQVPTGLDRMGFKAEESIKTISGVSDSMQGFDREDVAAKAIQEKKKSGSTNLVKPLDSLVRSDFILARNVLDLVQDFYTEERILTITHDKLTGETETFKINEVSPDGQVLNDLTLGEYDVVISSVPQRETLEDSQFDQAVAMRELGVQIPDDVLIENSRLLNKREIVNKMAQASQSPEAQAQQQLAMRAQTAEAAKTEAEAQNKQADTVLKQAKAQHEQVKAQKEAETPPEDNGVEAKMLETHADIALSEKKFEHEMSMKERELAFEQHMKAQEHQQDARLKEQNAAVDRAVRIKQANQPQQPTPTKQGAK